MSDDCSAYPNDVFVSDAEKLELALCLKSALESRHAQVVAVIWPKSTLQIINLKPRHRLPRNAAGCGGCWLGA
jgi:hypothetical protein